MSTKIPMPSRESTFVSEKLRRGELSIRWKVPRAPLIAPREPPSNSLTISFLDVHFLRLDPSIIKMGTPVSGILAATNPKHGADHLNGPPPP